MINIKHIDWSAWISNIALIVVFREISVWCMTSLNHPELGNLVGLISLLICLILWRVIKKTLPQRIMTTNSAIMKQSAFAFLPISAGALLTFSTMGREIPIFLIILLISTLIPLWLYAKISKRFL